MKILPIVMTINEERFIKQTLLPLSNVFPVVIVADTGSEDNALQEMKSVPKLHMMYYDHPDMKELGLIRGYMSSVAKTLGATHVLHVDGDEIYTTKYLTHILNNPMPETMICGYTLGHELAELENGEIWKFKNDFNRCCVYSVDAKWRGEYPYESPDAWQVERPELPHYWNPPNGSHGFYHMHHLYRSHKDSITKFRLEKKDLFAMQEQPDNVPVQKLLDNWKDYEDDMEII
jgi:glycosyltransferase involved in cell wall biosynthesis